MRLKVDSSLIEEVEYENGILIIHFKSYYISRLSYDVPKEVFIELTSADSVGKYYLQNIKPKFSQLKPSIMADTEKKARPKGINKASDKKRFIKMSIDVTKLNKDWFVQGANGAVWVNMTLQLLPDGTVDKYENLGMITQDVPKEIYEKDKKVQGAILGNGAELEWQTSSDIHRPGEGGPAPSAEVIDDLPF